MLIESTARIEAGFSGGPLIDTQGRLVGLNVAVTGHPDSKRCRGYAVPLDNRIHKALADLNAKYGTTTLADSRSVP